MDNTIYFIDESTSEIRFSNSGVLHGDIITDDGGAAKFKSSVREKTIESFLDSVNKNSELRAERLLAERREIAKEVVRELIDSDDNESKKALLSELKKFINK